MKAKLNAPNGELVGMKHYANAKDTDCVEMNSNEFAYILIHIRHNWNTKRNCKRYWWSHSLL